MREVSMAHTYTAQEQRALTLFANAKELCARGHVELALRTALVALVDHPYHAEGHHVLAGIYEASGDAERARDEWETAARLDPEHAEAIQALERLQAKRAFEDEDTLPHGMRAVADPAVENSSGARVEAPGMPAFEDPRVIAAILADPDGMVVTQYATEGVGDAACQTLGALLSSLAQDATATLGGLGLGELRTLRVECTSGAIGVAAASQSHIAAIAVKAGVPLGLARRYLRLAQQHARRALQLRGLE